MGFAADPVIPVTDAGHPKGKRMDIACQCWFTSTGAARPLLIKFKDHSGEVHTVHEVTVLSMEEKHYCGALTREYACEIIYEGRQYRVKLLFFVEECRWACMI